MVGPDPGAVGPVLEEGGGEPWDIQMDEDEDMVLGGIGDGEMSENELNASYHGEDMSEDESDGEGEVLNRGGSGCKDCRGAVAKLELRLRRLTSMVSLLMADRGLAGYGESKRCEKERRRCAQNRSEGQKKSQQDANLGALKNRAEALERKKRAAELLAEEEAKRQARELEQVDAELEMATAERERAIAGVVGAKDREEVVVASKKVTYAMAAADAAAKRREELVSEGVVVGSGFQVVQGRKLRSVEMVTRVVGKVDKEKRANLEKTVLAVQSLLIASRLKWRVSAVPYTVHGGNEVVWTVSGVSSTEEDEKVIGEVRHGADTAWDVGTVDGCWVEEKESVYVVVRRIPEGEWVGEGGGVEGLRRKHPMGDWGQRRPIVVRRAFSKVDVKAEVAHALSATYLVRQGMM